ncbi:hypothetical protein [Ferroplasma sp.]|uniref:hypothetical protein n=1 Tax=Ferroplasma sp. TaxID=2591003 RepID=UPI0026324D06|nr:hypothetical protein [Ferroplasma sp.]MCL4453206.1 hypothetical protein [Candidatus Thermoplasmatota archaeon]
MENRAIDVLKWLAILGSAMWAGIHMTLLAIKLPYIVKVFFGFVIAIAIVSAMIYVSGKKSFYLPVLIFYILDTALLLESRITIAPVFGVRLPWTASAIDSIILDIVMIILSGIIYFSTKNQK